MDVKIIAKTVSMVDGVGNRAYGMSFNASSLSEYAGRVCYQSFNRPNPATSDTRSYLGNIIDHGHLSVLEHGAVTFDIKGVSRSLTHELVRHRHMSFSQLSQRFFDEGVDGIDPVIPPFVANSTDGGVSEVALNSTFTELRRIYNQLVEALSNEMGSSRKRVREAARSVLPNMTPTQIVVTANHRSWREFLLKRGSVHADAEIRELACRIYSQLVEIEPSIYQDITSYAVREIITGYETEIVLTSYEGVPDGWETVDSQF